MIGGAVWFLFRFVVVALLVLRLVPADPLFHVNLIWVGAASLVIAAIFVANGLISNANRYYLPVLRIGLGLTALSDVITVLTRSYAPVAERGGLEAEGIARLVFVIAYGILAVDLLIFAALVSYRPVDGRRAPRRQGSLPRYESTDLEDDS
jgi:hypothetical protein